GGHNRAGGAIDDASFVTPCSRGTPAAGARADSGALIPMKHSSTRTRGSSMSVMSRRLFLLATGGAFCTRIPAQDVVYQFPMDPDGRSNAPGVCPRCGMKLSAHIPEPVEFPMDLSITPRNVKAGQKAELEFAVHDPQNAKLVEHFQIVHEKLFHMFVISR